MVDDRSLELVGMAGAFYDPLRKTVGPLFHGTDLESMKGIMRSKALLPALITGKTPFRSLPEYEAVYLARSPADAMYYAANAAKSAIEQTGKLSFPVVIAVRDVPARRLLPDEDALLADLSRYPQDVIGPWELSFRHSPESFGKIYAPLAPGIVEARDMLTRLGRPYWHGTGTVAYEGEIPYKEVTHVIVLDDAAARALRKVTGEEPQVYRGSTTALTNLWRQFAAGKVPWNVVEEAMTGKVEQPLRMAYAQQMRSYPERLIEEGVRSLPRQEILRTVLRKGMEAVLKAAGR